MKTATQYPFIDKKKENIENQKDERQLQEKYGGTWKYIPGRGWFCDDNVRYVVVEAKYLDEDGEWTDTRYFMHEKDKAVRQVYLR